jgi:hypothetical protein
MALPLLPEFVGLPTTTTFSQLYLEEGGGKSASGTRHITSFLYEKKRRANK